jgi:hypothetical protein
LPLLSCPPTQMNHFHGAEWKEELYIICPGSNMP